jgi:hypothetical protein
MNDNINNNMDRNIKRKRDFLTTSTTGVTTSTIRTGPTTRLAASTTTGPTTRSVASTIAPTSTTRAAATTAAAIKIASTSTISKSLSQLSISQGNPKKKKTITTDDQLNRANNESLMNSTEKNKPSYLKVPDRIFKQLLSNAIDNGYKISQCLDTKEKLHCIRQIAEITNNFYFKDLQRQLWQEYYNLSLKHGDNNCELTVTKSYAHQHNTCRMYRPHKSFIEQRQTTITHQLQRIGNQLQENLLKLQQNTEQWQPSIDFNALSHAINECVKHGQQRLKNEFNYKKEMLLLNWTDHQLITKFYKLKPLTEEQIELAKKIWQATADELRTREQLEILRQRIFLKRLPTKADKMVNELLDDNQTTLSNPFLDQKQRASFASRCSKTIIQCKFNLMIVQIDEFETMIRHHHLTLTNLQDKLSKLNKENPSIYTNFFMDSIEERRQAMIERFIRIRQHKLKTFFDEAPTVDDNNNN